MPAPSRSRVSAALAAAGLISTGLVLAAPPSTAAPERVTSFTRHAVDHGVTGKVRNLPHRDHDRSTGAKERENPTLRQAATGAGTTTPSAPAASPTVPGSVNAYGLGVGDNVFSVRYAPPDTNGDVGLKQYVQSVNDQFAVFEKGSGARIGFPFYGSSLFSGMTGAGAACADHDDGDPVVQYDRAAGRWLLTQFQVTVTPYLECVAVSDGEDATAGYHVYAYSYGTDFVDYPKVSVWTNAYAVTYNVFRSNRFSGGEVCVLDRSALLAGSAAAQRCWTTSTTYGGLLASDLDGTTPPPASNPDLYVVDMAGGRLNSWRLHVDWSGTSTFTGPTAATGTASFTPACSGGGTCIPQPGTSQKLDSLADRLMNRLTYRVLPSGPSLVVTHAVTVPGSSRKTTGTGVRWYELRPSGNGLAVFQQGTHAPDATHRWMSTAAMDRTGSIAVGYSASSSTVKPAIRVASHRVTDPAGTLGAELTLQAGGGSQMGQQLSRWGDYASMSVDPIDDCTLWFTTEYLTSNGAWNWSTRIMSLTTGAC